jgi:dihydrofolate reductase
MIISIIAAVARNRVIGVNNQLPWHLPEDLQYFKKLTMGKPIIMGRRTHESIGKPLPSRQNIIVTRSNLTFPGCETAQSIECALDIANGVEEIFIIGGAQIYKTALPLAHRLYLTEIDIEVEGDTYFPQFTDWIETQRQVHTFVARRFRWYFAVDGGKVFWWLATL